MANMDEPMKIWGNDSTYNMNTAHIQNIRLGEYWLGCLNDPEVTFEQVVDEIYSHVKHLEPYSSKNPHLVASTGWCCLYKLFTMHLTNRQVSMVVNHKDSPFIQAIGLLYLRHVCEPKQLWEWYKDFINDTTAFTVQRTSSETTTIGDFVKLLMSADLKFHSTQFPRIPIPVQRKMQKELLVFEKEVDKASRAAGSLREGDLVDAKFSEDGVWYEAEITDIKGINYGVTYTKYGNSEVVSITSIRVRGGDKGGSGGDSGGRSRDRDRERSGGSPGRKSRGRSEERGDRDRTRDRDRDRERRKDRGRSPGKDDRGRKEDRRRRSRSRSRDRRRDRDRGRDRDRKRSSKGGGSEDEEDLDEEIKRRERERAATSGTDYASGKSYTGWSAI